MPRRSAAKAHPARKRIIANRRELVDPRLRIAHGDRRLLAALGEISTLAELDRKRMFHTPDLRQERGMLSFEARNRSRGVTLDRAGLLNSLGGLTNALNGMVEDGKQIRLESLEFANAALALK